jgi:hypothetical protein
VHGAKGRSCAWGPNRFACSRARALGERRRAKGISGHQGRLVGVVGIEKSCTRAALRARANDSHLLQINCLVAFSLEAIKNLNISSKLNLADFHDNLSA